MLFILGATIFNMLTTVICFLALLLLYAKTIMNLIPENGRAWGFPVIFIGAIALSFVIYRAVLKVLMKKISVDKYFDPIFKSRQPRKNR